MRWASMGKGNWEGRCHLRWKSSSGCLRSGKEHAKKLTSFPAHTFSANAELQQAITIKTLGKDFYTNVNKILSEIVLSLRVAYVTFNL